METLFRGKRLDNNQWIYWTQYGKLTLDQEGKLISGRYGRTSWVYEILTDMQTEGQFTGLYDCRRSDACPKGQMIFVGDIVTGLFLYGASINAVVAFQDGAFGLEWYAGSVKRFTAFTSLCNVTYEVIGNIHDNPELVPGGAA